MTRPESTYSYERQKKRQAMEDATTGLNKLELLTPHYQQALNAAHRYCEANDVKKTPDVLHTIAQEFLSDIELLEAI